MARQPRRDYEGAWHHLMNRGARRTPVLQDDQARGLFLTHVADTVDRHALEVHAYAVLANHYHLLVRSVRGNISRAVRHLMSTFTQDMNRRYNWDGPIFRGRFRSQLIEDDDYLLTVAAYIHLNPIRAGEARHLGQRCWTSHRAYLDLDTPPEWLNRDFILTQAGGKEAFSGLVQSFRTGEESWPDGLDIESGWIRSGTGLGAPRRRIADAPARQRMSTTDVLRAVARIASATPADMCNSVMGRGGNPARRFAMWALFRAGGRTHAEIAVRLQTTPSNVAVTIRRLRSRPSAQIAAWIAAWEDEFE